LRVFKVKFFGTIQNRSGYKIIPVKTSLGLLKKAGVTVYNTYLLNRFISLIYANLILPKTTRRSFFVFVTPFSDINVGENVKIGHMVYFEGKITLQDFSHVGPYCNLRGKIEIGMGTVLTEKITISALEPFYIGNYCAVAPEVSIITTDHDYRYLSIQLKLQKKIGVRPKRKSKGVVKVGNDVWIGKRAVILSGVEVGDGAIIGAGAVVTKNVEPYSIVAGAPAEIVGYRFPKEIRTELNYIPWWKLPPQRLVKLKEFFEKPVTEINLEKLRYEVEKELNRPPVD